MTLENPPAFPNDPRVQLGDDYQGMTLRDWFAGQIIAADVVNSSAFMIAGSHVAATRAYLIADAMLAARKDGGQ